ncbi:MAG: T9SS type A sorting domain-containing protein [Bacteroidota bacterium]|nr:T9SS type A sorting domain-containing protein [Bacteroidota bacterium]
MRRLLTILLMMGLFSAANAQKMTVSKAAFYDKTAPLKEMKQILPGIRNRSWKDNIIKNEFDPRRKDIDRDKITYPIGPDPLWQSKMGKIRTNDPIQNFEGMSNVNGVYPPDTDGDVGPNHYFQMINLSMQIFDKEGNSLYGPVDNSTLWDGFIGPWTGTNDGDPIILYDEQADRWMASQFAINTSNGTYWELIAISETSDPLGAYYRYAFQFDAFNDYPKFGIWPDGYYCSFNMFGDYNRVAAASFERDAMLAGDPEARMIVFDLDDGVGPWSMLPSDMDGTPPADGTPNYFAYMIDDSYDENDQIRIWEFKSDWDNVANSTFQESDILNVAPFDSELCSAPRGRCVHQPNDAPKLESLSDRLMYRLQYRNFGDYQVMLTNHTVDVDNTGHAGIRWYEFRNYSDGNGWNIHQQGTYAPDADNRWMGSIAMDSEGIIALGYSVSSTETFPSIRYTGRGPNAPLGEMVFTEETIIDGGGSQGGTASRWGDYSHMSVDPTDDLTFWYTAEYYAHNSQTGWRTRIASFNLEEDFVAPDAITDLSADYPTTNAVWLRWTATADNQGKANSYEIRYSTTPVTELTWNDATIAPNTIDPQEAGVPEEFYLSDLNFNTEYYFAVKVKDRQYNTSEISNSISTTTPGEPNIIADNSTITQIVYQGQQAIYNYQIQNTGESDIRVHLYKTDTITHNAGEILNTYSNIGSGITGLMALDNNIFLVNNSNNSIDIYNVEQQEITETVAIHDQPFGITFDGEYFWVGSKSGTVYAYNTDWSSTDLSFNLPEASFHSLTWNGECFLVTKLATTNPKIKQYSNTGELLGYYTTDIDMGIWQTTWVDQHRFGKLWITNNSGIIAQLYLDGNTYKLKNSFDAPTLISYSLGHDGSDIIYAKVSNQMYSIDDNISEVNWLDITPLHDTIAATPIGAEIAFSLNATDKTPGNYLAKISIENNDPENGLIEFDVVMSVLEYNFTAQINNDTTICSITPFTLQCDVSGNVGSTNYLWSSEGFSSTLQNPVIIPEESKTYQVTITDDISTINRSVDINVIASPQISLGNDTSLCENHTISIEVENGHAEYLWFDGSMSNSIIIDSTLLNSGSNNVWISVTAENGCVATDTTIIILQDCSALEELSDSQIKIYPNPTTGKTQIVLPENHKNITVKIFDQTGKQILTNAKSHYKNVSTIPLDFTGLNKGSYLIVIKHQQTTITKKIMVL